MECALGRGADPVNDVEGDTLVKVPALNPQRDDESAKQQEDDRIHVAAADGAGRQGGHAHSIGVLAMANDRRTKWQYDQRQQGGCRNRDGFGRPPGRHQDKQAAGQPGWPGQARRVKLARPG